MRIAFYLILVFSVLACTEKTTTTDSEINHTLNPILGNTALEQISAQQRASLSEVEKVQAHLSYVHDLLVRASANYPESVREKRLATLELLADYIETGQFPMNVKYKGRRPCFIDANGTYCAVGHLVKETAGEALATLINTHHQYDYISDMDLDVLTAWIAKSGFTLEEIAMIQPTYNWELNAERRYHTGAFSNEVRNGNTPNFGWGYHFIRYRPMGSRLGGHFMRSIGAVVNHYEGGDWSVAYETERSLAALKRVGLSLNSGLGARYANFEGNGFVQGVPSASLNLVLRRNRKLFIDLGAQYQYAIPLINQEPIDLNRHAFVFRFRLGYQQG
jgi:hypothetical protein